MNHKFLINTAILSTFIFIASDSVQASPQLDLPPLNTPTPQPEIYYNGYPTSSPAPVTPTQARGDLDRSQRYGPPYIDDGGGEDGIDDYRYGQTYDERMRYGYGYPNPSQNFSSDSPFSDRANYRNDDIRYANHNYDNENERYHNRFADVINDQRRLRDRYNNPSNSPINNPNININSNERYTTTPLPPSFYGTSTYDPNNQFLRNGGERNRFENPYINNQDRFNLNDRYADRERLQQDRRYQIELEKLRNFLVETDHKGSLECTANVAAQWNFETNVNEFTQAEAKVEEGTMVEEEDDIYQ